jgi:CNT family concentrative nucleoside transporter
VHDGIELSTPPAQQPRLEKQHSSSSSGHGTGAAVDDDKHAPSPAEQQYAVDPEKQSERVGSLHVSEDEPERGPLLALWLRHWKKVAQLVTFMVFTAFVTPFR